MQQLVVTFGVLTVALVMPGVFGQGDNFSNGTSTISPQDIYDLSEEDFQLWVSGRTPKKWVTSTTPRLATIGSSTTLFGTSRLMEPFNPFVPQTTSAPTSPQPEFSVTPRPASTTTTTTSTSPPVTSPIVVEDPDNGYFYRKPQDFQSWLKDQMQHSQQITNQLVANFPSLPPSPQPPQPPQPPRLAPPPADCVPISQILNHQRPAAVSFQTSATIHRFHDPPTLVQQQNLPKPNQPQLQIPQHPQIPQQFPSQQQQQQQQFPQNAQQLPHQPQQQVPQHPQIPPLFPSQQQQQQQQFPQNAQQLPHQPQQQVPQHPQVPQQLPQRPQLGPQQPPHNPEQQSYHFQHFVSKFPGRPQGSHMTEYYVSPLYYQQPREQTIVPAYHHQNPQPVVVNYF